ncbi:MAG: DUF427 domain-containing protein [Anaerolineales bacterium]|nr:DUF427 domain-containing protein [Anaerolineales bacterium]
MSLPSIINSSSIYTKYLTGPVVEPSPRWVRVKFGGEIIADSKQAWLLRQYGPDRMPTYYFPQADVRTVALRPSSGGSQTGETQYWDVKVGDRIAEKGAWTYLEPPPELAALKGYISFKWGAMEAWYEEEEEVFVHARDPYKRVDVMPSSRHVRVVIAGETVAETRRPYLLFETSLPTRYYLPREDVRMDLLEPTGLKTRCPYKGIASYWSVKIGDQVSKNVVWSYPEPISENPRIKNLMCFFNERVDLYVDGELQPRPLTPWSINGR